MLKKLKNCKLFKLKGYEDYYEMFAGLLTFLCWIGLVSTALLIAKIVLFFCRAAGIIL